MTTEALWFVPLLLLVVRPLAVWLGLLGSRSRPGRTALIGWFGIRGIGSLYYLSYAIEHGLPEPLAERLLALTFATVITFIAVHGVSVTPRMRWYSRRIAPAA